MKKLFVGCGIGLIMVLVLTCLGFAQDVPGLDGERQLRKFPKHQDIAPIYCGDYFIYGPTEEGVDPTPRIGLFLKRAPSDPTNVILFFTFKPEAFEIVIDNGKKVPTTEIVPKMNGGSRIVIRISQRDYDKSPCLAKAKKAGEIRM